MREGFTNGQGAHEHACVLRWCVRRGSSAAPWLGGGAGGGGARRNGGSRVARAPVGQ
jgi:hypothetical protein